MVRSIWCVDLDNTLLYSDGREECVDSPLPFLMYHCYAVYPRPTAEAILYLCREHYPQVVLVTAACQRYAEDLNARLHFGFSQEEIIAYEQLQTPFCRNWSEAILIDDLPPDHLNSRMKHRYLGMKTSGHYQIPSFDGFPLPNDDQMLKRLYLFLRNNKDGSTPFREREGLIF